MHSGWTIRPVDPSSFFGNDECAAFVIISASPTLCPTCVRTRGSPRGHRSGGSAPSVHERVGSCDAAVKASTILDDAALRRKVGVSQAKATAGTEGPLEVVHQRPTEVST